MGYLSENFVNRLKSLPEAEQTKVVEEVLAGLSETADNQFSTQNSLGVKGMDAYVEEAIERHKTWGKVRGLSTGFRQVDRVTLGLAKGELITVAAGPGVGKTLFASNIAYQVALAGHRVLFISLEMPQADITDRYLGMSGGDMNEFRKVSKNTFFQESEVIGWKELAPVIEQSIKDNNIEFVIIDHLHFFPPMNNPVLEYGAATLEIRELSRKFDITVMLLAQFRKRPPGDASRPTMWDIKDTTAPAFLSNIILILSRDKDGSMMITVDKNRRGKPSDLPLHPADAGKDVEEINTIKLKIERTKMIDPENQFGKVMDIMGGGEIISG